MRVIWGKGRRSRHSFMPIAKVTYKEDPLYDFKSWYSDSEGVVEGYRRFCATRRTQSLRSILRRVRKMNYPKGTRIVISNWFVGYADVMIIV